MGGFAKIAVMVVSVVLALVAVITLRRELGQSQGTPAEMSGTVGQRANEQRVTHQPTILQAKPSDGRSNDMSPMFQEQSPDAGPSVRPIPLPLRERYDRLQGAPESGFHAAPSAGELFTPPRELDEGMRRTGAELATGAEPSAWTTDANGSKATYSRPWQRLPNINDPSTPVANAAGLDSDNVNGEGVAWPTVRATAATYVTQANDSLWNVSLARYGSGEYYKALFQHNRVRIHRPDRIEPGIVIETPDLQELQKLYPNLCPRNTISPATGDRLRDEPAVLR